MQVKPNNSKNSKIMSLTHKDYISENYEELVKEIDPDVLK